MRQWELLQLFQLTLAFCGQLPGDLALTLFPSNDQSFQKMEIILHKLALQQMAKHWSHFSVTGISFSGAWTPRTTSTANQYN